MCIRDRFSTFTGWLSKIEWSSLFKGVGPALQGVKGAFSGMSLGSIGAIAAVIAFIALFIGALIAVSYTHLDVYKRQQS